MLVFSKVNKNKDRFGGDLLMLFSWALKHAWQLVIPLAVGLLISSPVLVLAQDEAACEAKLESLASIYRRAADRKDPRDEWVLSIWYYEQRIKILESSCPANEDNRRRIANFRGQLLAQQMYCGKLKPNSSCAARGPNSPNLANVQSAPSAMNDDPKVVGGVFRP